MTEEIAASDEGVGKGAFGFMRDAAEAAVSSPEARAALSSCENFMAFERGMLWALPTGASSGVYDNGQLTIEADRLLEDAADTQLLADQRCETVSDLAMSEEQGLVLRCLD